MDDTQETLVNEAAEPESSQEFPSDKVADLIEMFVCGLVEEPEQVSLDVTDSTNSSLIEITCAQSDTGKIIGKHGRTIKSIRTLARALGHRLGITVEVEVLG